MPDPASGPPFIWTSHQRRALIGLLTLLLIVLIIRYVRNPSFISDPPPEVSSRAVELADHLDPNTASWESLAAIPNFGQVKAKAIAAYRTKWKREHPNPSDLPFRGPQDLRNVKGIGPATVSNMMPYLVFPGRQTPVPPADPP